MKPIKTKIKKKSNRIDQETSINLHLLCITPCFCKGLNIESKVYDDHTL